METQYDLVVIGSGPAGYNAALYGVRGGLSTLLLTGMEVGGQLTSTHSIENWIGEVEPADPNLLMEKMRAHAEKYGAKIVMDTVTTVTKRGEGDFLVQGDSESYHTKAVVVATGASAKYLGLPSESAFKGRGVSTCATCDGFFYKNQVASVIGGGNTALEEALYLARICEKVHLIHRREGFRAEDILQRQLKAAVESGKIQLHLNRTLKEVLRDDSGVTGVLLESTAGEADETLITKGLFVAIGHKPNSDFLGDLVERDEHGFVKKGHEIGEAEQGLSATTTKGLFVAGDVADSRYRQAITAAASGCQAAMDAKHYIDSYAFLGG